MSDLKPNLDQASPESPRRGRIVDYLLLTATLAFADEFRVDHERRTNIETSSELRTMLSARLALKAELTELESRVGRISRSLTIGSLGEDASLLVQGYAVLDLRRIQTAIERIHRHLLTLYPSVSAETVEVVRQFSIVLESTSRISYQGEGVNVLSLLADTLAIADTVRREIG